VNDKTGLWFDHSTGQGGNIIEAVKIYERKTYIEALERLFEGEFSPRTEAPTRYQEQADKAKNTITAEVAISHPALLNYTRSRGISDEIAQKHCKQIHYQYGEKQYFGIGWKNESGGICIRNPLVKMNLDKGGISVFKGSKDVLVFEGYFDYLTYLEVARGQGKEVKATCLVLNSTSQVDKALVWLENENPNSVSLYLDNDKAGDEAVEKGYKDLNEWHSKEAEKEQKRGFKMGR
jgi:DNA primase